MRDEARIMPFCNQLADLWSLVPDWRFGQLVLNLSRDSEGEFEDPWHWEEEEWEHRIAKLKREIELGMTFT